MTITTTIDVPLDGTKIDIWGGEWVSFKLEDSHLLKTVAYHNHWDELEEHAEVVKYDKKTDSFDVYPCWTEDTPPKTDWTFKTKLQIKNIKTDIFGKLYSIALNQLKQRT